MFRDFQRFSGIFRDVQRFSDYSGILLAVAHEQFLDLNLQLAKDRVIYDVKSQLDISDKAL